MRERLSPPPGTPKNQEISITLKDGRTFAVCSEGQYRYLLENARNVIISNMIDADEITEDIAANEDIIRVKVKDWSDNKSHFATIDWLLERMSPQEREDWKQKYRFGGVNRKML